MASADTPQNSRDMITTDGSLLMQAAQNGVRIWRIPAQQNTPGSKE